MFTLSPNSRAARCCPTPACSELTAQLQCPPAGRALSLSISCTGRSQLGQLFARCSQIAGSKRSVDTIPAWQDFGELPGCRFLLRGTRRNQTLQPEEGMQCTPKEKEETTSLRRVTQPTGAGTPGRREKPMATGARNLKQRKNQTSQVQSSRVTLRSFPCCSPGDRLGNQGGQIFLNTTSFTKFLLFQEQAELSLSNKHQAPRASTKTASSRWSVELFKAVTGTRNNPNSFPSTTPKYF